MNVFRLRAWWRFAMGLALSAFLATSAIAQTAARTAKAGFPNTKVMAANEPFDIILEGSGSDHNAVSIGKLDVSALFDHPAVNKLRYHGRGPALPAGTQSLTVYDVDSSGAWSQIGQVSVRLLSRRGFLSSKFEPTADLTGKGQLGETHTPSDNSAQRDQFQDATTQLGFRTELVRPSFTVRGEAQVAGVTYQNEALRFGVLGERAPRVDLSGYRFDVQRGSAMLSIGHLNIGNSRHLINGFSSRGAAVTVGQGHAVSLQLAAVNGSNIVGWSNAIGLENDDHRIYSATVGIETRPRKPGLLRLEYGYFLGSSQPVSGFNQGAVVSAEKSTGSTLRVLSATPNGRFRFDGGYTFSRFEAGIDRQLEAGLNVTPIKSKTSNAHYVDISLGLLQGRKVWSTSANLGLNLRREQIQPQFRSLGTSVQADLRTNAADLTFSLGAISGSTAYMQTRDNLGGVASILTTQTERSSINMTLVTAALLKHDDKEPLWAPILSLQSEAIHQFGDVRPSANFPIEGIPDEAGWNTLLGAEWQVRAWRFGGKVGRTTRDSRQVGSERRDFLTDTALLTFGWTATKPFSINAEIGFDQNESLEQAKTDRSLRWSGNMNWTFYRQMAVAGSISNRRAWDSLDQRDSENIESSVELSAGFRLSKADRRKGRLFVRWSDRRGDTFDRSFGLRDVRRNESFATGLTFSLF